MEDNPRGVTTENESGTARWVLAAVIALAVSLLLVATFGLSKKSSTPLTPTLEPMATSTNIPTATPVMPMDTLTPVPPTHTPTATSTSTPTATPHCRSDYIQNLGFETGRAFPWVISGHTEITDRHRPHNGIYSAWLGGYNNTYDELYQNIAVPPNLTYAMLTFWYYLRSEDEIPDSDHFSVYIRNSSGRVNLFTLVEMDNTDTTDDYVLFPYQLSSTDLSSIAAAGGNIQLYFQMTTNGEGQTAVFVDDIILEVCQ